MPTCEFITNIHIGTSTFSVPCCDKAHWMVVGEMGEIALVCDVHKPIKQTDLLVTEFGEA